ncbi:carbohydrate ABC transporter permease [Mahella australiensis]|uniref:Binding-protein-dependent transport systems inner membrane component n=1 Tax=Mahella australiensis (strain DSM 15567 / CIP 107919 / 50-1 BON) TaxID=697281 RepID=F3ZVA0_MAHA5|nr:carbohydrate ABC transporter permease [Mahella australiensis]AEE95250.1 binding-protein-dependent transport systems inner membrane component [Mahella australiensis 50-1 BON]
MSIEKNIVTRASLPKSTRLLEAAKSRSFWSNIIFQIAIYILLLDFAFVFLFPFIYMIITSLKSPTDLLDMAIRWIPKSLYLDNYSMATLALNYWTYLKNSIFVTVLSIVGNILSCSFVAYGFARCKFRGRDMLFLVVLLTLIIPPQTIVVPLFIQYSRMNWINTYLPLIIPTFFGMGLRGGLFVFIFRQFFRGLPYELEDAARIDGCSSFRIYWNIIMPISKPAILVSAILSMVWHWNDYFEPSIYLMSPEKGLLPMILPQMGFNLGQIGYETVEKFNAAVVMAGTFLVVLPLLIVYIILQRQFMEGIERTGLVG